MGNSALIEDLERQFGDNPQRVFARLASEYRKAGDLARAIELCRTYVPQQPGYISGHIVLGQALYESGELDEAQQTFETALELDPENLIALRQLGDIAYARGDIPGARSWYTRLLDVDPQNEEVVAQLAALDGSAPPPRPSERGAAPSPDSARDGLVARPNEQAGAHSTDAQAGAGPHVSAPERHTPTDAELSAWWSADTGAGDAAQAGEEATEGAGSDADGGIAGIESFASMFGGTTSGDAVAEHEPIDAPLEGLTSGEPSPFGDLGDESSAPAEGASRKASAFDPVAGFSLPPLEIESTELELGTPEPRADAGEPVDDTTSDTGRTEQRQAVLYPWESQPDLSAGPDGGAAALGDQPAGLYAELREAPSGAAAEVPWLDVAPAGDEPGVDDAPDARRGDARPAPEVPDAFLTETMAELYVQQGLLRQGVEVYRRLVAMRPSEDALRARLVELEEELALAEGRTPPHAEASASGGREETEPTDASPAGSEPAWLTSSADPSDEPWTAGARAGVAEPAADDDASTVDAPASPPLPFVDVWTEEHAESSSGASEPRSSEESDVGAGGELEPAATSESTRHAETEAALAPGDSAGAPPKPRSPRGPSVRAFFSALGGRRSGSETPPRPAATGPVPPASAPHAGHEENGNARARSDAGPPPSLGAGPDAPSDAPGGGGAARTPDAPTEPRHDLPGEPSRAAPSALSLDAVFRESLGRPARGESLDDFFAESEDGPADGTGGGSGPPPASAAADLEAFNAWLEGLKK